MMDFEMSFFNAPICPIKDEAGHVIVKATLTPSATVTLSQVYGLITQEKNLQALTEEVRASADFKAAKQTKLPYVMPCGTFARRSANQLLKLSGLLPLDVDGLSSREEAEALKRRLFDDEWLTPALCFISPSGRGVKAFVPFQPSETAMAEGPEGIKREIQVAIDYLQMQYGTGDSSGCDIARCCFLCHDAEALMRVFVIEEEGKNNLL